MSSRRKASKKDRAARKASIRLAPTISILLTKLQVFLNWIGQGNHALVNVLLLSSLFILVTIFTGHLARLYSDSIVGAIGICISIELTLLGSLTTILLRKRGKNEATNWISKNFGKNWVTVFLLVCLVVIGGSIVSEAQPKYTGKSTTSDHEVGVVVARFLQTGGTDYEPEINMVEVLQQAADAVGNVNIITYSQPILTREQAQSVSDQFNATMVIYGRVDPGGVVVHYEISPRFSHVEFEIDEQFRISSTAVDNFEAFLFNGMDASYILEFTIGQLNYFNRKFDKAVEAFDLAENALSADRINDENLDVFVLYNYRANSYAELGQLELAILDYDRALLLTPLSDVPGVYVNRGNVYSDRGQYERALEDYGQALYLNPNFEYAYYNRGVVYKRLNQYQEAIVDFTQAIEISSSHVLAYRERGDTYFELGQYEQAIADYDRALNTASTAEQASLYGNRGLAYQKLGDQVTAINDFSIAARLSPLEGTYYFNRGISHFYSGSFPSAIDDFSQAIMLDPNDIEAYINRGATYARMGQHQQAISNYNYALSIDQNCAMVGVLRGRSYAALGQLAQATRDFNASTVHGLLILDCPRLSCSCR